MIYNSFHNFNFISITSIHTSKEHNECIFNSNRSVANGNSRWYHYTWDCFNAYLTSIRDDQVFEVRSLTDSGNLKKYLNIPSSHVISLLITHYENTLLWPRSWEILSNLITSGMDLYCNFTHSRLLPSMCLWNIFRVTFSKTCLSRTVR
jgi:hypothetical protein